LSDFANFHAIGAPELPTGEKEIYFDRKYIFGYPYIKHSGIEIIAGKQKRLNGNRIRPYESKFKEFYSTA
jgi:hypothetical protein